MGKWVILPDIHGISPLVFWRKYGCYKVIYIFICLKKRHLPRTTPNPSQAEGEGPEGPWEVGSATAAAAHAADGGHGLGQAGGTTRGGGETTEGGLGEIGKNDDILKTWKNMNELIWTVLICTIVLYI